MLWSLADNDNHDTNILTSFAFNGIKKERERHEKKTNKHEHWTNQTEYEFKTVAWMKTAVVKPHIATQRWRQVLLFIRSSGGSWHRILFWTFLLHGFCVFVHSGLSITSKWLTMPISISGTFYTNAKLHADKMDVSWIFVKPKIKKKTIHNFSDPNDNSVNNQF